MEKINQLIEEAKKHILKMDDEEVKSQILACLESPEVNKEQKWNLVSYTGEKVEPGMAHQIEFSTIIMDEKSENFGKALNFAFGVNAEGRLERFDYILQGETAEKFSDFEKYNELKGLSPIKQFANRKIIRNLHDRLFVNPSSYQTTFIASVNFCGKQGLIVNISNKELTRVKTDGNELNQWLGIGVQPNKPVVDVPVVKKTGKIVVTNSNFESIMVEHVEVTSGQSVVGREHSKVIMLRDDGKLKYEEELTEFAYGKSRKTDSTVLYGTAPDKFAYLDIDMAKYCVNTSLYQDEQTL